MKAPIQPLGQYTIEQLLTNWPETVVVFKRHSMACIGCDVSHLYTVAEAIKIHRLPMAEFIAELEAAISEQEARDTKY